MASEKVISPGNANVDVLAESLVIIVNFAIAAADTAKNMTAPLDKKAELFEENRFRGTKNEIDS